MALDSTNPQTTTREINQIQTTITTPAELPGALLETEKRLPGGAYQSAKLPVAILLQAATALLPGSNDRKDLRKAVRTYDTSTPEYYAGASTLTGLNPDFLCLAAVCLVNFGPAGQGKEYVLVYDPSGPLQVYEDGRFTGPKVPARWVLLESDEAATTGIDTFNELTDFYQRGKQVIATLQGSVYARLFELQPQNAALTQIRRTDFTNNKIPAPTGQPGDPYWVERPLSMPGYVGYQVTGRALALSLVQNSEVTPARFYRIVRYGEAPPPRPGRHQPGPAARRVRRAAARPHPQQLLRVAGVEGG